jgi:hypothetical protein
LRNWVLLAALSEWLKLLLKVVTPLFDEEPNLLEIDCESVLDAVR